MHVNLYVYIYTHMLCMNEYIYTNMCVCVIYMYIIHMCQYMYVYYTYYLCILYVYIYIIYVNLPYLLF